MISHSHSPVYSGEEKSPEKSLSYVKRIAQRAAKQLLVRKWNPQGQAWRGTLVSCRIADQQSRRNPNEFVLPIESQSSKLELGWKIDGLSNRIFSDQTFLSLLFLSSPNKSTFVFKKHLEWCFASSFVAAFCLLFESSIYLRRMRMKKIDEHQRSTSNRTKIENQRKKQPIYDIV